MQNKLEESAQIIEDAIKKYNPSYIVSMVSGGKDSTASHAVARELGIKVDCIVHGNTRTGIPQTTEFVENTYGKTEDLYVADAGSAYEDRLHKSGFFGLGVRAHSFAYHVLKAAPFRATISKWVRKRKHGKTILLLNGARRHESPNRMRNLKVVRPDPGQKKNVWVSPLFDWTMEDRDLYLNSRNVPLNPVAKNLCCSGECMCGTMQTKALRMEASVLYPEWGQWLDNLEKEVKSKHGIGWGDRAHYDTYKQNVKGFFPMCTDCLNSPK